MPHVILQVGPEPIQLMDVVSVYTEAGYNFLRTENSYQFASDIQRVVVLK